ncbi:MAG: endolytic transglycosylase MltG [Vicingaceae bacterium]|nr:endolytic transglycosylase MltG [Vicingaceae bacterium]
MFKKIIISLFLILLIGGGYIIYNMYTKVYQPNVTLKNTNSAYFHIHSHYTFDDVINSLYENGIIINRASFKWVAEKKSNFINNIKPGRYKLKEGMSNNELIDLLRSGEQEPVKVTFNNVRTIKELAGTVTKNLECDSVELYNLLSDKPFISKYGFNTITILTLFLPNTYEFYWNTSAEEFVQRMAEEYKKFWTEERIAKARALNLSQSEVAILASIVQAEQSVHRDERAKIAGLYINRLRKGMLLQSDPTVVYGIGDFNINRVLTKHLETNTPYNTYIYKGLPPGPINLPEISSLDAVLNFEKHNYIYMCAKADFSGYHAFASNYNEHLVNARNFQRELNRRKIYK